MVQSTPEWMNEMEEKAIITNTPRPSESPEARLRKTVESLDTLLATRGATHGNYDNHALVSQNLKNSITPWYNPDHTTVHRESLEMIAHKIGRILAGDPNFRDHWDDIAGYARLAAERCSK